jgi:hypothetical protein
MTPDHIAYLTIAWLLALLGFEVYVTLRDRKRYKRDTTQEKAQ